MTSNWSKAELATLRGFIEALEPDELLRIKDPVPVDDVPSALVMELEKSGKSPVIMMENVQGSTMPVMVNLLATRKRIARIAALEEKDFYPAWGGILANPIKPRIVESGPAQELVFIGDEADCNTLPLARHFAEDGGRYINAGVLVCKDPDTGVRNLSYQRLCQKGPRRFSSNLGSRGDIWEHLNRVTARGKNLEVAIVIGAPPAFYLAAAAKVAMDVDEYDIAGSLMGQPMDLVKCKTIDMEVPADAEIVIEGELLHDEHENEGPVAEYTGYSSDKSTRNVFVVKAITRRRNPIFMDIVPGTSSEHLLLAGIGRHARDYARLKEMIPGLKAINFPRSGLLYHAYFSFKRVAEGEARRALMLLFGLDPYLKLAIAVDEDVDVFNEAEVMWALATRFQADTDMFVMPKVFCNQLDPSSHDGMGAKLGIDATVPRGWKEQKAQIKPEAAEMARALIKGFGA